MSLRQHLRPIVTAAAVACGLALSACGGVEGVELNGKLFDMMGISTSAQEGKSSEPKMAERAPLVLPPNVARLPEPGSGKVTSADIAALSDPEERKRAASKERERLHDAYCRGDMQWREKALDPNYSFKSPYGPCANLVSGFTGKVNK